ncbi:small membrane A-kinase anchor protein [Talpa occidentalis]|uniref:small membrane A-kinase anchor protein n=1 Tax=Talpa occidentalis TaxID=50954 RepID=UPI00188F2895|nr:small membrane A-kinase anchor protein [Talpa occidentalis]XP_037379603.1 small membrane A-kinase anchor protein [Talpa occidentalis]XP_037379604.1 small membrane A-kinase anchor protein [Talpa occidentalis]XP_037379605.1 small membrane A-kinase anchor protein [Talpa occidentalis]XP_037379606.1 small membrane A-kinase anchor protein [Talpa occidentalis]
MGCVKSKQTFPFPTTFENDKRHTSKESFVSEERVLPRMASADDIKEVVKEPSGSNVVIFEFAHRLSQKILSEAIEQWASNNIKYYDIPYIESEGLDAGGQ